MWGDILVYLPQIVEVSPSVISLKSLKTTNNHAILFKTCFLWLNGSINIDRLFSFLILFN